MTNSVYRPDASSSRGNNGPQDDFKSKTALGFRSTSSGMPLPSVSNPFAVAQRDSSSHMNSLDKQVTTLVVNGKEEESNYGAVSNVTLTLLRN